ncbi:ABC transporter permease subunit [Dactylosporangium sp. NPDC051541]|uniref:ABC transporter permease subunit n=1 Tax=Dactylosporangium sp. NPDC051541 TaxID=3363977 RepID=UPI0037BC2967
MMFWFTWRQFRAQTVVAAGAIAALGVLLLATAHIITDLHADVAACTSDCGGVIDAFLTQFHDSAAFPVYLIGLCAAYAFPPLVGAFWGAPLIARELETGTYRLAWNQSVTRTRWLAGKLLFGGAVAAIGSGLLSLAVTLWSSDVDVASKDRILPLLYGSRGVVPVAYAVFAFVLGVTIGILLRRVVAAMATTLAVYVAVAVAMPLWLRARLVPVRHETIPLTADAIQGLSFSPSKGTMSVRGAEVEGAWTLSSGAIKADGSAFTGPGDPTACDPATGGPRQCGDWLQSQHLTLDRVYHPDSQFWTLQWAEAGLFLGLAAVLAALCFWWIRQRVV